MITIPWPVTIRIQPIFWLLLGGLSWLNTGSLFPALLWAIVIFTSLVIHEYGHAFTARYFNQEASIELTGLGGVTTRRGPPLKRWQEFLIILNGPLAGFALAVLAYYAGKYIHPGYQSIWEYLTTLYLYVNVFWTFLNLMPVQPLDGGRLLGVVLEGMWGLKGERLSYLISALFSATMTLFFLWNQWLIAAALFILFGFESFRSWQALGQMSETDRDSGLQQRLIEGERLAKEGKHREAIILFQEVAGKTGKGILYQTAIADTARVLIEDEQYRNAYNLLKPLQKTLQGEGLSLLFLSAYKTSEWNSLLQIGSEVYHEEPTVEHALINACANARLGQVASAIGWLRNAIHSGLTSPKEVLRMNDFDPIRDDPAFRSFQESLS